MLSQTLGTALGDWNPDSGARHAADCCSGDFPVDPYLAHAIGLGGFRVDAAVRPKGEISFWAV